MPGDAPGRTPDGLIDDPHAHPTAQPSGSVAAGCAILAVLVAALAMVLPEDSWWTMLLFLGAAVLALAAVAQAIRRDRWRMRKA